MCNNNTEPPTSNLPVTATQGTSETHGPVGLGLGLVLVLVLALGGLVSDSVPEEVC